MFDNLTKIWHEHSFKFGFVYNYYQKTENLAGNANAGSFAFTSATSTTPTGTSLFNQAFANFLTGNVATFSQTSLDVTPDIRANQFELYAQDSWRLRPNLTVDFGVRYSNFRQPIDAKHEMTNFDPAAFSASQVPTLTSGGLLTINAQNYLNGIIVNGQNSPFGQQGIERRITAISRPAWASPGILGASSAPRFAAAMAFSTMPLCTARLSRTSSPILPL